ncbi:MAG: ATP-binding protein [Bifidobacteriaceae bacterium]|nr:ATP-binding protein [Bifidobacteriaceae bacterium]
MLVDRPLYMERVARYVDAPMVKVLTGPRRAGKSRLLALTAQLLRERGVPEDRIMYLDFDALELDTLRSAQALSQHIASVMPPDGRIYVLLDEVQEVEQWERLVNSLAAEGRADVYVTGSNSTLLSSELATYIAGRYVSIDVWPLSFREHLAFAAAYPRQDVGGAGNTAATENVDAEFTRYLRCGGFPGIVVAGFAESDARAAVADIYRSTLIRDALTRHAIRDTEMFERVAAFTLDNIGNPFSARRVAAFLKSQHRSVNHQTVANYLAALAEAFVITRVPRFDIRGKALLATDEKYYVSDHGLVHALFGYSDQRLGGVLENIIWAELRRRGWHVRIGKSGAAEVDFVADRHSARLYIQVAVTVLASPETRRREYAPLEQIRDSYPKYVLTLDPAASDTTGGIRHQRIPDFLLDNTY